MSFNRREFIQTAAAALAPLPLTAQSVPRAAPARRPNILLIVADQLNIDAIAAYRRYYDHPAWGAHWVSTPHLDRLVAGGVSFLESHSTNPVCCPARSSLFTGRMSTETGVTYNNVGIDRDVPNMGQWFGENSDYDCVYCGKWHAGGAWNYPQVEGTRKIPGFKTLPVGGGGTGDIVDYQVSGAVSGFVRNYRAANPFLIVAGLMNPHDICYWTGPLCGRFVVPQGDPYALGDRMPILPPNQEYPFEAGEPLGGAVNDWSALQWRNYLHDYYRMVEKLDSDLGRMLDAVASRADDTIVIMTADHGEGCGRHRRVQKWHPYDQSVKVPLIFACPGRIRENHVDRTHLVSGVDIMSTLCDFAGIAAPPHARGLSLRPILSGSEPGAWRDTILCEVQHTCRVLRSARYKYVKRYSYSRQPDQPYLLADGSPAAFEPGRSHDYQVEPHRLLFDMKADPWEQTNLAGQAHCAGVIADHEKLLVDGWENRLIPGRHFDRN